MPFDQTANLEHPLEFAGYDLVRRLGRGGMGEVWSVVQRGLYDAARALAIKVMLPELSEREDYCDIFIREGRTSMQFSSSDIVPVFELGRHDGLLYMVMERVDGVNLAEFQRRTRNVYNRLQLDVIGDVIGKLLSALYAAHEHTVAGRVAGVLHRDVKPANVLVSSSGDVRLTDFGIAGPVARGSFRDLPPGTWRYMPPEQAMGRAQRCSDLFAVGAIFHELLSGRPFRPMAQNTDQLLKAVIEYREVPKLDRPIPRELEALRRGLLEPDPRKRFQSAEEAMLCLAKWRGFRYARIKLIKMYATAIGTRSSGFTDTHNIAAPSFLLHPFVREPSTSYMDNTLLFRREDDNPPSSNIPDIDEDAKTVLRMPWLRRFTGRSLLADAVPLDEDEGPGHPVLARERMDEIGPHPAAPVPEPHIGSGPNEAEPHPVTPTARVLYSVVQDDQAPKVDLTDPNELDQACDEIHEPAFDAPMRDRDARRDSAAVAGTIVPEERQLEIRGALERAPRPYARQVTPGAVVYMAVIITLLCALVSVSTAWFMSTRATTATEGTP